MTATERRYQGSSDEVLSMDDATMYGETFEAMSFKEAVESGILSDYKIITTFVTDDEIHKLVKDNVLVKSIGSRQNAESESRALVSLVALRKAMQKYPIKHAVSFHSSIAKASDFQKCQDVFTSKYREYPPIETFHVFGAMPTAVRSGFVNEFAACEKGLITNAKCLTEGVDVPGIDAVLFADPRRSTVDIVQAVGRALRKKKVKNSDTLFYRYSSDHKLMKNLSKAMTSKTFYKPYAHWHRTMSVSSNTSAILVKGNHPLPVAL